MKKHLFTFTCLAIIICIQATSLSAQNVDDHKYEVGLRISGINFDGFNSFSAIYKKKLDNGKFRRISGSFGGINLGNEFNRFSFSINAGFSIGNEKRRQMGKRTSYYTGPSFSLNAGLSKQESFEPNWNLAPSLGYILGIQYDFSEYWAVNLETIPSGSISLRQFSGSDVGVNVNASFSSNVVLSLMHKF